jgi:hypothetical protein
MECSKCKTRNNYYHNYCYNCGAKMDSVTETEYQCERPHEISRVLLNKRREFFNPYRKKKLNNKRILYLILISSTAVFGMACWVLINS